MTQSTIGAPAESDEDLSGLEWDPRGNDRRRTLIVALGGALVALLVVGLYLVISSGKSDSDTTTSPQSSSATAANAKPGAAAPAPVVQVAPVPVVGRDPFANLPTAAAPVTGGSTTGSGSSTSTAAPVHALTLVSVSAPGQSAVFTVDGKRYAVKTGAAFATDFRLYALFGTTCAGVLYGDQNVAICAGDAKQVGG